MKTSLTDFNENTCQLFRPAQMFAYIHGSTNGDPCMTGCAFFDGGKCLGYRKLRRTTEMHPQAFKQPLKETNAEMAERLGISKRQIAKMRKEGRLLSHIA